MLLLSKAQTESWNCPLRCSLIEDLFGWTDLGA
ncbi:hypothetical protein AVEN_201189-1 [Araneus ventricosus]|uniref:Uncharacterized protein n=1 Tax=Araneus ventricosus TaxID=182803 RepID=A0A4Y2L8J4_ARAVE|nr:hypothetical protein AVEN_201189-1 [Araneus ventricosus]